MADTDPLKTATSTKNATWTVNDYDAAVCITSGEINKKMTDVFNSTDDFPKSWQAQDAVAQGEGPKWKINATQIGAPYVNFASDFKNGVNLNTGVEKGEFQHLKLEWSGDVDKDGNPINFKAVWEKVDLDGIVFNLSTNMKNIEHIAGKGETVDDNFTVQALYADLDNPKILTAVDTSKALKYKAPDDTSRSVAQVLLDMCKSDNYKNNYVFGKSKIPNVAVSKGPFTPRAMRFSTFQDVKDKTVGSINWNLMVSGEPDVIPPLPDLSVKATAGAFDEMPVPGNIPGIMLVSFGKIIKELIVPNAFKEFSLDGAKFSMDPANVCATLNTDVDISTNNIKSATFTSGNTKIYPDPKNNRLRVDFVLEHIDPGYQFPIMPTNLLDLLASIKHPKYKATWSGYITLGLSGLTITSGYSQDSPSVSVQDDTGAWRYVADIGTLGLHELERKLNLDDIKNAIKDYVSNNGDKVLPNINTSSELPGGAVFEIDTMDWVYLGLRTHLKYAPYTRFDSTQESSMKSGTGTQAVTLTFVNNSGAKVTLYELDANGAKQNKGELENGQSKALSTFVSHVWDIYNDQNKCIGLYRLEGTGEGNKITINLN